DAVLAVFDAAGKQLATQDDQAGVRDAELSFSAPADGTYRLELRDLYGHGSARHVYRLSLAPPAVDFALSLSASEFVCAAGKSIDIPVSIDRRNGFAEAVTVTIQGLPDDARCDPVTSAAKGESAKKITLKLVAGTRAFRDPITIVGRSTNSQLVCDATAAITGLKTNTHRPWLTITAK
ncbi:MAG TPA: hypothetical protein VG713_05760, partial [Pirellulales bacterium]|nr:hypothetical protein [Pirellulales bacterium]